MNLNQETRLKNVWYFRGTQPIIEAKRKGESANFYGALNIKDGKEITVKTNKQNSQTTIKFLKKLSTTYNKKKILLIWDNASWHKSKLIRKYLTTTNQFELFNFPPYSPEFNPQEQIWKQLRQNITHNRLELDFNVLIKDSLKFLNNTIFNSIKYQSIFG